MRSRILIITFLALNTFVFGQQDRLTLNHNTASFQIIQEVKSAKLISIKVKGTNIDILPNGIDIITSDIHKTVKDYVENNDLNIDTTRLNKLNNANFFSFTKREILYFFSTPQSWTDWFPFEEKDVLYTFNQEKNSDIEKFAIRYNLKKIKNIESKKTNDTIVLYSSSPNYYVILVVKETFHQCVMHPEIISKTKGVCSICGMELIHIDSH